MGMQNSPTEAHVYIAQLYMLWPQRISCPLAMLTLAGL